MAKLDPECRTALLLTLLRPRVSQIDGSRSAEQLFVALADSCGARAEQLPPAAEFRIPGASLASGRRLVCLLDGMNMRQLLGMLEKDFRQQQAVALSSEALLRHCQMAAENMRATEAHEVLSS